MICTEKNIAEDICVLGCGNSKQEADLDHDKNLTRLLEKCNKHDLRLSGKKFQFKSPSVTFMGHELTDKGVEQYPAKVEAITKMMYSVFVACASTRQVLPGELRISVVKQPRNAFILTQPRISFHQRLHYSTTMEGTTIVKALPYYSRGDGKAATAVKIANNILQEFRKSDHCLALLP